MENIEKHTSHRYDQELEELYSRLIAMGAKVEKMISDSIDALVNRDVELANKVVESDDEIDSDEVYIDKLCLSILATRQPVARDLRFITTAFKIVTDLERIADCAVGISTRSIKLSSLPQVKPYEDIPRMAELAKSMIREVIDAFLNGDTDKAREVCGRDGEIDELNHRVIKDLLPFMIADESTIKAGFYIQAVAKLLERIGDHATNIAEQVVFMVEARDIRHSGSTDE
ncbi:MAG TPA: phosphate signaling complex protein PhoU [Firmicutes bacterium]|nr:phosphate signaling complex protein PhoU [Bacillota bacterium]